MTTCRAALFSLILLCLAMPAAHAADWSCDGEHGPDRWADLSVDFAACDAGSFQSPFNLVPDIDADLGNLDIHYAPLPVAVTNNGHIFVTNGAADDYVGSGIRISSCSSSTSTHPANARSTANHSRWNFISCIRLLMFALPSMGG
jgi:hypothetical protein